MKENDFQKITWKILESYFGEEYLLRLVRHQLESYNYFIETQIQDIIKMELISDDASDPCVESACHLIKLLVRL